MNVLLISSSENIALDILGMLSVNGHRGHILNIWRSSGHARRSRWCAGYTSHFLDSLNPVAVADLLQTVTAYCARQRIEMILPVGLWGTMLLAELQGRLPARFCYPLADPKVIYALHNKWLLYQQLLNLNVPVPATRYLAPGVTPELGTLHFPVVIKPVTQGASAGFAVCSSEHEVRKRLTEAPGAPKLLQDWVPGLDAVFGLFANAGELLAWTLHLQERDHLTFFDHARIVEDVSRTMRATGFTGVCNFDLRFNPQDGTYRFLECNPRFWASINVSAWAGVDVVDIGMLVAQSMSLNKRRPRTVSAGTILPNPDITRYFWNVLNGRVACRRGMRELPWRRLMDLLPIVLERIKSRSIRDSLDDTHLVEDLFGNRLDG